MWTDDSGRYTLEAELVTFNDRSVVLERADHEMVAIPREQLSQADREFLESKEAAEVARQSSDGAQTWTLRDGTKLVGQLVDYAHGDMTIQRRRGNVYVNDRRLANLPEFYQLLVPQIVAHVENLQQADGQSLEAWLVRQRGAPRTFHLDGVVFETSDGDEYTVPFFLFSDDDQRVMKSGWDEWLADDDNDRYDSLADHAFMLRTWAAARQHNEKVQHQIATMQLKLQAVEAGLTSLWEVTLFPAAGRGGRPQWVVVPGRDSRQATAAALEQHPGFVAGPVRRVAG